MMFRIERLVVDMTGRIGIEYSRNENVMVYEWSN